MEITFFEKEVKLHFRISREESFTELFSKLSKAIEEQNFQSTFFDGKENNIGLSASLCGPLDRPKGYYCNITLMEEDEERFYKFINKFCEENGVSFKSPIN